MTFSFVEVYIYKDRLYSPTPSYKLKVTYYNSMYVCGIKDMTFQVQGVSKKNAPLWFCLSSQPTSSVKSWDISQMKGDIHTYVLSASSFLCYIGEPRYRQNNTGY